jgi:tetratricopeptide (TPR) repeat protein
VERELLGVRRDGDVAGWEIPGRYLEFVRGGSPRTLEPVLAHNAEDLASLARLLAHLDSRYADPGRRPLAPAGDLLGLARAFARERRHEEALVCLDEADRAWRPAARATPAPLFGGLAPAGQAVSRERILAERARTLRRLGRLEEALAAWDALAHSGRPAALAAWIETAKILEHALGDMTGALRATFAADRLLENRRLLGLPDPVAEAALGIRRRRLLRRLATTEEPGSRAPRVRQAAYPGSRDRLAWAPRTNPP